MKRKDPNIAKNPSKVRTYFRGLQLVLVQSIVCVVAVLIALLLRMIDGNAFSLISMQFRQAMLNSDLMSSTAAIEYDIQSVSAKVANTDNRIVASSAPSADQIDEAAPTRVVCAPLSGGVLTSSFGQRDDPFDPSVTASHHGVDIAAAEGTPLAALTDGVVESVAYEEYGYGHHVLVKCADGHEYLYAHCSAIHVAVGQTVSAGEVIAAVGNTGRSTGSHVHIEWRENGVALDPMTVLPEQTYV